MFGGNGTANLNNGLTGNVTTNTLNTREYGGKLISKQ